MAADTNNHYLAIFLSCIPSEVYIFKLNLQHLDTSLVLIKEYIGNRKLKDTFNT